MKVQQQISQKAFKPEAGFIKHYQELIKKVVIPYQYAVLNDKAEGNTEKSHVIKNFINAGNVLAGKGADDGFYGMVFQDSDAAKWLEAAAFSLAIFPDKELEATCDKLIDIIAAAQDKDGYLDTYFTIKDQEKRWTNLCEAHELYCAGHMMEAAVAYAEATGKNKLLEVMLKNVNCIYEVFLGKDSKIKDGYPGHPEVELALMKMYRLTGEKKCLELARHFIKVRGVDPAYYEKECKNRGWTVWGSDGKNPAYNQADKPVLEQTDAAGHAVRAVYLYTGMADAASEDDSAESLSLKKACRTLWESITRKRMYVTGGIGSTVLGEAFSVDYDLPGDTAYCETCASIGLMFFASRMLEMDVDSEYSDIMERAFYNTVLAGMQQDGKRFFYVNPLEVIPGISGTSPTQLHDLPERPTWYACACCPPNTARLISSFGKYAYGENESSVFCHLFAAGTVSFANGSQIRCKTEYPYDFKVEYEILKAGKDLKLAVRLPSWSKKNRILKNKEEISADIEKGYAYITIEEGDVISLELDGSPYYIWPSNKIPRLSGQACICRGPLVYCAEGKDNKMDLVSLKLEQGALPQVLAEKDSTLPEGVTALRVSGFRFLQKDEGKSLYFTSCPEKAAEEIKLVPYYSWGNRGPNQMKVWLPVTE
ncbi:MAG: glycoside hydrolase family 127 protein [Treponemataceae bacterium]|nr:glycoside hydrolase family 127 protein [Treponemataceae bacterium]